MGSPITGSSAIIGPDGRLLKTAESGGEQLIIADLNMSAVTKTKTFADAGGHCESEQRGVRDRLQCRADLRSQIAGRICCGWEQSKSSISNVVTSRVTP